MLSNTSSSLDDKDIRSRFKDLFTPQNPREKPFVHGIIPETLKVGEYLRKKSIFLISLRSEQYHLLDHSLILCLKSSRYTSFIDGELLWMEIEPVTEDVPGFLEMLDNLTAIQSETQSDLLDFPKPNSIWFNNRRKEFFRVIGMVSPCADEDEWEVLYRSESWESGEYRRRTLSEWHGTNREGYPRFIFISESLSKFCSTVAGKRDPLVEVGYALIQN